MNQLYSYKFLVFHNGYDDPREIIVYADQDSTAWVAAAEKASRLHPKILSIKFDGTFPVEMEELV